MISVAAQVALIGSWPRFGRAGLDTRQPRFLQAA
jgi:hypothetical protein